MDPFSFYTGGRQGQTVSSSRVGMSIPKCTIDPVPGTVPQAALFRRPAKRSAIKTICHDLVWRRSRPCASGPGSSLSVEDSYLVVTGP